MLRKRHLNQRPNGFCRSEKTDRKCVRPLFYVINRTNLLGITFQSGVGVHPYGFESPIRIEQEMAEFMRQSSASDQRIAVIAGSIQYDSAA